MPTNTDCENNQVVHDRRKPWLAPVVEVIRAGDAEAGANAVNPEGPFGMGS